MSIICLYVTDICNTYKCHFVIYIENGIHLSYSPRTSKILSTISST